MNITDNDEICEHCGKRFGRWRHDQRFCSRKCHSRFHAQERREAVELYREMISKRTTVFDNVVADLMAPREEDRQQEARERAEASARGRRVMAEYQRRTAVDQANEWRKRYDEVAARFAALKPVVVEPVAPVRMRRI